MRKVKKLEPWHKLFAEFSIFYPALKAHEMALQEAGCMNIYSSTYAYKLKKDPLIQAYQKEFFGRLSPYLELVRNQMKKA